MSRRALGSEHASQFEINQSIVVGSVSASNKNVNFVKVCFKRLSNFQVKKKRFDIPTDSYEDRLFLFNVHLYDEFHVPDVLIMFLYM